MLKQHKFLHFIVQFMCHIIDNVGCGTVVTIFLETRRNDTSSIPARGVLLFSEKVLTMEN
jgi:hypothetical protein